MNRDGSTRRATWLPICWALPMLIIQGIEGVEKSFNAQLTGKPGRRLVRKDKHGNVIENITEVPPVPAHNLQLSIDERLQTVTEDALDNAVRWNKAESGAAVLIKIDTGEILAMASYPDFNPNNRDSATLDDFRNRAISDTFEPGSTVKPLVIMTALQQGLSSQTAWWIPIRSSSMAIVFAMWAIIRS